MIGIGCCLWALTTITVHALPEGETDLAVWTGWINTLKPIGQAEVTLTLTQDGRPEYRIVIPSQPTSQEQKAAEELQTWLRESSGAVLPIDLDDVPVPQGSRIISVGQTHYLSQAALELSQDELGNEGYGIAVQGDSLFLWGGRTRGIINAVFALLEEDLGFRWYTKEGHHIPHQPTLAVAPVSRTYVPKLKLRDPFYHVSFDGTWSLRNRTNAPSACVPEEWGGHIDYDGLFVHTFHALMPPNQYFEDHPDYFMLDKDGHRNVHQLCTTHPEVVQIVTDRVEQILQENPHSEILSVSKTDGGRTCQCERCKELDRSEGSEMASLLHLVNAVAEAIEPEHPDVTISTLAYLETVTPPETMRPRRNVGIRLCNDNVGSWVHPFSPAEECRFGELLRQWSAVHDHMYIWDYVTNFSHYLAPMPNMDVVAKNIRFYVEHHAEGIMTQASYQSPGSERDWMRSWVIAKLLWNPSLDVWELMQDFVWGYYGEAAPAVAKYNRLLWQKGQEYSDALHAPDGGIRYRMDHGFLSVNFLAQATTIFEEAKNLAESEEMLHRVEEAELPVLYVQLCQGPDAVGKGIYQAILQRFEQIARRVGVTHLREGAPDLAEKLQGWRDQL